ncbi:protoheme IX farnesyltransferase [Trametes coccinea BRFM310]|uniref:Protoheme IX farnesyltransferase, mitochondrial n=1 Tax=Trametes coccinea (strain BRFM310) TaxID=1353009 RepID=A0A1Y2IJ46_TRAC3|nr:protoheme IX farnesyltransferase [Trametes coccinea BRFM310]
MRGTVTPFAGYVRRSCAASIRNPRKPLGIRLASSSSLADRKSTAFSAFFFDNQRWLPAPSNPSSSKRVNAQSSRGHSVDAVYSPAAETSVRSFRQAEVLTPRRLAKIYSQLAKSNLTVLIMLTAMSGVALSPLTTTVPVLLSTALGTALCSASANAFNQIQEVPYDAQMARTRNRPLVRRAISPLHATGFAVVTGLAGPALLWTCVNPTTALLGAANIALYAGAYTYLKRKSILNTWVGSVVGGIPPLMGWTACGGSLLPSSTQSFDLVLPSFMSTLSSIPADAATLADNPLAPLALFLLLYSWQFPHFNGLSHLVRESYAQAGYRMLGVLDPHKNATVALRHALLLVPATSILMPLSGLTTWAFALTSLVPHAICIDAAFKFWKHGGEKQARKVFQHSLWYLPVLLGLMMFHKRGMDWGSWFGFSSESVVELGAEAASTEEGERSQSA